MSAARTACQQLVQHVSSSYSMSAASRACLPWPSIRRRDLNDGKAHAVELDDLPSACWLQECQGRKHNLFLGREGRQPLDTCAPLQRVPERREPKLGVTYYAGREHGQNSATEISGTKLN